MWMLDVAREQHLSYEHLATFARLSLEAGYDAMGLYLEHRFAYPSVPWVHGNDCITPEMIAQLRRDFPALRLIPFINLLGHFEGFLYTEGGAQFREAPLEGLQACPSNPDFIRLCEGMIDDILAAFDDEIIHIGGDETAQLGQCQLCRARVEQSEAKPDVDGKAELYGAHFGPLAHRVVAAGRTPALWGDMFLAHPSALRYIPKESIIFDWQYFNGVAETAPKFTEQGFRVVGCPCVITYSATWCHLGATETNIREVAADVESGGLFGLCVTTWEIGMFAAYDSLFPILRWATSDRSGPLVDWFGEGQKWAQMMSSDLEKFGGVFTSGRIRNSLKTRTLLMANPFLAWVHHGEELRGSHGKAILDHLDQALFHAQTEAERGVTLWARAAVEWVRLADDAAAEYAAGSPERAIAKLTLTRQLFDDLAKVARRTHQRIGGSLADIERCRIAREHVETVIKRLRQYGSGQLGYRPAFEVLTHPRFCPYDQASWWLINKWANQ